MSGNRLLAQNESLTVRERWTILIVSTGGALETFASLANGTFACAIAEVFPIGVRYSGLGAGLNLGVAATMGTAPLVATTLVLVTHWRAAPSRFMVLCAGLALAASFALKPSRQV
jgi:nitrate/nitrite transporter NarK